MKEFKGVEEQPLGCVLCENSFVLEGELYAALTVEEAVKTKMQIEKKTHPMQHTSHINRISNSHTISLSNDSGNSTTNGPSDSWCV